MSKLYIGLDVSNALTSVCAIDENGEIVFESKVDSAPDSIADALKPYRKKIEVIGHESGALSQWIHKGLLSRSMPVRCLDAAHTRSALGAQRHKTDRNDALGIAQIVRSGWVKDAHIRSTDAARLRMAIVLRSGLRRKAVDLEICLRQCVKVFGIRLGPTTKANFSEKLEEAIGDNTLLAALIGGVLRARAALLEECAAIDRQLTRTAAADPVCRRLMTAPGVGPITALSYKAMIDDPARFKKSRSVGVYFGLTPSRRQSGEHDGRGGISKRGDKMMRSLLCLSASLLLRGKKKSRLQAWGLSIKYRSGPSVAYVAVARKLCAILHRLWINGGDFELLADPAILPCPSSVDT
jgi:transposase